MNPRYWCVLMVLAPQADAPAVLGNEPLSAEHVIVATENNRFHGWPANNGIWQWGDELLVGFTKGDFQLKSGHNIAGRENSLLARSQDGGNTWAMFDPQGFLDDGHRQYLGEGKTALSHPLDFTHPGFAMRIFAHGYHGNDDPQGGLFYSDDRGHHWKGPHSLNGLTDDPDLRDMALSPRIDYIVQGKHDCLLFISAHKENKNLKRLATVRTTDGGQSFHFVSWITPKSDEASLIMCQTVQVSDSEFVLTCRKIFLDRIRRAEIEAYHSADGCRTWNFLSTVKVMEVHSNPPALVKLQDGRLCCVYGDRAVGQIQGRYSSDRGRTWEPEFVIRSDFQANAEDPDSKKGINADIGYPRLIQRLDGKLVAVYYWTTAKNPQQHIAASIWKP
jgi:hypothetical protein